MRHNVAIGAAFMSVDFLCPAEALRSCFGTRHVPRSPGPSTRPLRCPVSLGRYHSPRQGHDIIVFAGFPTLTMTFAESPQLWLDLADIRPSYMPAPTRVGRNDECRAPSSALLWCSGPIAHDWGCGGIHDVS